MYLIAGLGNPTREYEKTRHNVGFSVIDVLADKYNIDEGASLKAPDLHELKRREHPRGGGLL